MRCPLESPGNASLLLDNCALRLDAAAAAALLRHMDGCAACREFQAAQRAVWTALDEWEAAPVSQGFNRRLYQRIDAEARAPWRSRLVALWKPVLPLAAACAVLVAVALFNNPPAGPPGPASPVRVEMGQVDQVESALEDLEMLRQFDFVTAANVSNSGSL